MSPPGSAVDGTATFEVRVGPTGADSWQMVYGYITGGLPGVTPGTPVTVHDSGVIPVTQSVTVTSNATEGIVAAVAIRAGAVVDILTDTPVTLDGSTYIVDIYADTVTKKGASGAGGLAVAVLIGGGALLTAFALTGSKKR